MQNRNQPRSIGIITNTLEGVFQREIVAGVREVAVSHDYSVLVDEVAPTGEPRPVTLDINALAGVVVIANVLPDTHLTAMHERGIPMTLVSHQVAGVMIPSVMTDNTGGIAALVNHLVTVCGRRRFVFIRGRADQRDGIVRERTFRLEMMRHFIDMPEQNFIVGDFDVPTVQRSMAQLLSEQPIRFDAIVAADYLMAEAAMDALRAAGLRVPQDVSVVGFGDAPEAERAGITTVAADVREIGRRCARQLLGQINGLSIRGVTFLATELIVRASCCPPTSSD